MSQWDVDGVYVAVSVPGTVPGGSEDLRGSADPNAGSSIFTSNWQPAPPK